jgi:glycosyltransferase involved in cell wall biosynthesis
LDLLIRAYAGVADRIPKSRLLLVGQDDGYGDYLERLAKSLNIRVPENLAFLGFITEREKLAALIDADVFVTPRFYGFPATFLESLMCGTPIVTTDGGDFVDWIDGRAGYVVNYDEEMIRDAIVRILESEQLRNELGQRGKEIAIKNHSWHNVAGRFERIYEQCIKEHA